MSKTSLREAISKIDSEVLLLSEGDSRARSIFNKAKSILESLLPVEQRHIEDAYREGFYNCKNEDEIVMQPREYFTEIFGQPTQTDHSVDTNDMVVSDEDFVKSVYPDAVCAFMGIKEGWVIYPSNDIDDVRIAMGQAWLLFNAWSDAANRIRNNK